MTSALSVFLHSWKWNAASFFISRPLICPCEGGRKVGVMEITREGERERRINEERKKPISCVKSDLCRWIRFVFVWASFSEPCCLLVSSLSLSCVYTPSVYHEIFLATLVKLLWPRLKYPNGYRMYCNGTLNRQSWSPEDESFWIWWSTYFFSSATMRLTLVCLSETFQQLLMAMKFDTDVDFSSSTIKSKI